MVAQVRFYGILNIAVVIPLRWLAGNSHELAHRNWGARHMGLALDLWYEAVKKLEENPNLILSEVFMMNIFSRIYIMVPEFYNYYRYLFKVKKQSCVNRNSGAKMMPLALVKDELFHPQNQTNVD